MKLAKFINFTDELFAHPSLGGHDELCKWNNEPYSFPAKSSTMMEDWKAKFFAKHLTNRELLKQPAGEYHTSPKNPEQDKYFMDIFNKCYIETQTEFSSEEKMKDVMFNQLEEKTKTVEDKTAVWCEKCGSLGVRHKKGCPMLLEDKKTVESNFEGLEQ